MAGKQSESAEQIKLAQYLDKKGIFWLHPPNEGKRHPAHGALLKRHGMKPGCPDVLILEAPPERPEARGVMIELKRQNGGTTSENQAEFMRQAERVGWLCRVCYGADDACAWLYSLGW